LIVHNKPLFRFLHKITCLFLYTEFSIPQFTNQSQFILCSIYKTSLLPGMAQAFGAVTASSSGPPAELYVSKNLFPFPTMPILGLPPEPRHTPPGFIFIMYMLIFMQHITAKLFFFPFFYFFQKNC